MDNPITIPRSTTKMPLAMAILWRKYLNGQIFRKEKNIIIINPLGVNKI